MNYAVLARTSRVSAAVGEKSRTAAGTLPRERRKRPASARQIPQSPTASAMLWPAIRANHRFGNDIEDVRGSIQF
ncbi:hypothetical protein PATSB16_19490 [Pandoraea thiooxydans]|nr:hypothetical protein PATSB16_19490 [Pandoraea thiooxydans]